MNSCQTDKESTLKTCLDEYVEQNKTRRLIYETIQMAVNLIDQSASHLNKIPLSLHLRSVVRLRLSIIILEHVSSKKSLFALIRKLSDLINELEELFQDEHLISSAKSA